MHGWPCSLYEAIVALRKQSFLNLLRQNGRRVTKVYRLVMYRLHIILCHCKENGCLSGLFSPVVIPDSQYHKSLLACYNLILILFLLLVQ